MKKITLAFVIYLVSNLSFSQGTDILSAEQFCSGTSQLTFNNNYGGTDNTQVGCLGSIPNAAYFYLEIDQPGDLVFNIYQEDLSNNPIDVDFIAWGPFTDLTDANNKISFTDCATCPSNTADPTYYPYLDTVPNPDSPIADCSYSANPSETMNILNAMQGEIYVVLITNYNGNEGTIDFSQTGGTGTTTCSNIPICGSQFYDSGGPTGDYFNNESYITTINPYFAGGTVTVDFTTLNLGSGDILTVYNGPNNTFPVLGTVTGAPSTFTSNTTGNPTGAISFEFISDGTDVSSGWASNITCTPPPTPPTCGSTFYDSGGSTGNYSNNEYQTITYYPDIPGEAITATFTSFDLEIFDDLYIFDGPNTASPLLGVYNGTNIPGPFTSSDPSGALTFLFDSDSSITYSGWAVDLTCAPYAPPVICGSTIYDSGGAGGNYGNNELNTTTVTPDIAGTAIVATFTYFDVESCCDELRIYDGPDATYPLLGTYAGTTLPPVVTSSDATGALTFVFESDFSITEGGYAIDISCVNTCNLTITDTNYPLGSNDCDVNYIELTTNALPPPAITTIFSESFNGTVFPAGWIEVNGATSADWIISATNNAGGTANEAMLDWITGGDNSTWGLNSPPIDITGYTNLQLSFKHDLWQFGTDFSIFLETSLDNTTWTTQYTVANPPDITETRNVDLSSLDGNNTLYLRFRFSGDSFDLFHWAIDDIVITADAPPSPPQVTWSPVVGLYVDNTLSTPYSPGDYAGTVYAAPNGVQTYTATDQNSCTDMATVTFNKKIWNGTVGNTDWATATNWLPVGVPIDTNCILIPDTGGNDPIIDGTTDGNGLNLTIANGATLTQQPNSSLTIVNFIDVRAGGTYDMEDSASLIQVDDVANTVDGNFTMDRNTNIRVNDYVYWSSPVTSFNIQDVSPGTPDGYKYEWIPFVTRVPGPPGPLDFGEWQAYNSGPMAIGKGYIVKGPTGHTATPSNYTAAFSGIPNNGQVTQNIQRSTYTGPNYFYNPYGVDLLLVTSDDDNWNLVGNPYPSAIDAIDFLTHTSNGNIAGSVYLWTHGTDIGTGNADPFYDDFQYNYNVADYIAYNSSGTSAPSGFGGHIGAGQGFFVLMTDSATTSETVTFDNSMRSSTYANDQFYRNSNTSNSEESATNRIWLDFVSPSGQTSTTLVAYANGATNGEDRMFDAPTTTGNGLDLYSLIGEKAYLIQGRQLPFDVNDQVPIGLNITESGIHTLAINTLQGLFNDNDQGIFIEDLLNGTIHDIKTSPYTFTSELGFVNDRFVLRFTNTTLGLEDHDTLNGVAVFEDNEKITVKSPYETIASIDVYDLLGRTLYSNKTVNLNRISIESISPNNATLLLKIKLTDGKQKIAKIIF